MSLPGNADGSNGSYEGRGGGNNNGGGQFFVGAITNNSLFCVSLNKGPFAPHFAPRL